MTSVLNKFEILQKDNKWKPISPKQEQIIALASAVEKLKDDNINLSKSFKTSPTGKVKGKGRETGKGKGQKPPDKLTKYGKGK